MSRAPHGGDSRAARSSPGHAQVHDVHAIAYLPQGAAYHARVCLPRTGTLQATLDLRAIEVAISEARVGLVIVDPSLISAHQYEALLALLHATGVVTLICCPFRPDCVAPILRGTVKGACLYTFRDVPALHDEAWPTDGEGGDRLALTRAREVRARLVQALRPALERLPTTTALGMLAILEGGRSRASLSAMLVLAGGISRRALERQLARAGLAGPAALVRIARLLLAIEAPGGGIGEASRRAGFATVRALGATCRAATSLSPTQLLALADPEAAAARLTTHLLRCPAPRSP